MVNYKVVQLLKGFSMSNKEVIPALTDVRSEGWFKNAASLAWNIILFGLVTLLAFQFPHSVVANSFGFVLGMGIIIAGFIFWFMKHQQKVKKDLTTYVDENFIPEFANIATEAGYLNASDVILTDTRPRDKIVDYLYQEYFLSGWKSFMKTKSTPNIVVFSVEKWTHETTGTFLRVEFSFANLHVMKIVDMRFENYSSTPLDKERV